MSNSYRKTPITGWSTADSEKSWKRSLNRRRRRAEKLAILRGEETLPNPVLGEFGPKDGRQWLGDCEEREYARCMRK